MTAVRSGLLSMESSTPVTVTICVVVQLFVPNTRSCGEMVAASSSELDIETVTLSEGSELSETV